MVCDHASNGIANDATSYVTNEASNMNDELIDVNEIIDVPEVIDVSDGSSGIFSSCTSAASEPLDLAAAVRMIFREAAARHDRSFWAGLSGGRSWLREPPTRAEKAVGSPEQLEAEAGGGSSIAHERDSVGEAAKADEASEAGLDGEAGDGGPGSPAPDWLEVLDVCHQAYEQARRDALGQESELDVCHQAYEQARRDALGQESEEFVSFSGIRFSKPSICSPVPVEEREEIRATTTGPIITEMEDTSHE